LQIGKGTNWNVGKKKGAKDLGCDERFEKKGRSPCKDCARDGASVEEGVQKAPGPPGVAGGD